MRWRAEVNKHLGVESEVVDRGFIKEQCPEIDLDCGHNMPIHGALYHAPGAIARHDAVAWGYGRGANLRGAEIHQNTAVTGIRIKNGKVKGVETSKGLIETGAVLSAVAGYTPRITEMVDLRTPIVVYPLQACVTEPLKPWARCDHRIGELTPLCQSVRPRGELVMGAALDPYEVHSTRSTLEFVEGLADHLLELFPFLGDVKVLRQWGGLADMTPDFAPIMGKTRIEGFSLMRGGGPTVSRRLRYAARLWPIRLPTMRTMN